MFLGYVCTTSYRLEMLYIGECEAKYAIVPTGICIRKRKKRCRPLTTLGLYWKKSFVSLFIKIILGHTLYSRYNRTSTVDRLCVYLFYQEFLGTIIFVCCDVKLVDFRLIFWSIKKMLKQKDNSVLHNSARNVVSALLQTLRTPTIYL